MAKSKTVRQRKQEKFVIIGAVAIIALSVLSTLWFSGVLFSNDGGNDDYKNITLTDALITCENQARQTYGERLLRLVADDHSNRFDERSNQYKIFFQAAMSSQKTESGVSQFFISCFVNANRGRIADFDGYEQKNSPTEAIRQDEGGMFGWPIKK